MIHAPWMTDSQQLLKAGVVLGENYPGPIIDHAYARLRALEALKSTKTADKIGSSKIKPKIN
jgi:deoxyribodipyrimidine photo-lyase